MAYMARCLTWQRLRLFTPYMARWGCWLDPKIKVTNDRMTADPALRA